MWPSRNDEPAFLTTLARFLAVGLVNSLIGLATIFACLQLGAGDIAANASGYGIGLVFSFFSNRGWTFGDRGPMWPTAWRFVLVFAFAYASNLLTTMAVLAALGESSFLAHLAGMVPYTLLFYLGSKYLVFNNGKPAAKHFEIQ
jgi:putative flippase GtrA